MNINFKFRICLLAFFALWGGMVKAGIIVGGTRVIYNGGLREANISVNNPDKIPYLIQAWADGAGQKSENKSAPKAPFLVTPPIFRLDPGKENLLRIIRTGGTFPNDRESIYWVNVKSIPAMVKRDSNVLQVSVKTRIKLFYRPEGINSPTEDDYKKLSFRRDGNVIKVSNPTPYYITFLSLNIGDESIDTTSTMVPPLGTITYSLKKTPSVNQVTWRVINDFGGGSKPTSSPLL